MRILRGLTWFSDVVQVLVLDRLNSKRRRFSELANTSCRELKFHSRARIRSLPLAQVISRCAKPGFEHVSLPGPFADMSDVGNTNVYHALGSLVRALEPKRILEFGTYLGVGTQTMALNAPADCRIYTVDLPDEASPDALPELNATDKQHIQKSRYRVGETFLNSQTKHKIVQIRADSMTFRAKAEVGEIDLVFVDGGHSLPMIRQDTENAFRVLSPTGTIIWDDYFHSYPDVVHFLDELQGHYSLCGIAGTNLVIYSRRFPGDSIDSGIVMKNANSGTVASDPLLTQTIRQDHP